MSYLGDFQLETTFDFKFTTVDNTGLPVTLASGVVVVYEDNSISEITGAETLTLDFDGLTGLHNCRIAATAANGFGVGQEYQVVVSVGTIDSISAVGYVVGSFSIENRAALMPTTNGTRLDVTATGAAGIDWANVENPTTALDLSGTDIQLVDTCTTNTDMVGTDSALLAASAPTNFGDMSITVTTGLVDITQTAADKVWSTAARTLTAFSTSLALSVWDVLESAIVTASTIGLKVKNNLDAAITSRLAPTTAARTLDINAAGEAGLDLDNTSGTIDAAQIATDAITAAKLASDVATEIRDAILPLTNTALSNIEFLWVAASDHVTPVTGASTTSVTRSIDGGAFGAGTGTLAEVGNGIYQYDASQADMNGGIITFRFVATGGTPGAPDDAFLTIVTSAGV